MRVIFIVGDHITDQGRGKDEAEQFAMAACTVLSRMEGLEHEIHLFYYCNEQPEGCGGKPAQFKYPIEALKEHALSCAALKKAQLKRGNGEILVNLNWTPQDLIRETRRLIRGKRAAILMFAHGSIRGIQLGHIEGGPPKEGMYSDQFLRDAADWKLLFMLHMHCHAGQFFLDNVYPQAKALKIQGLGISNQTTTQGHVMLAATSEIADKIINHLALIDADGDYLDVYEHLSTLKDTLADSSNGLLTNQVGVLYGKTQKQTFAMGTQAESDEDFDSNQNDNALEEDSDQ